MHHERAALLEVVGLGAFNGGARSSASRSLQLHACGCLLLLSSDLTTPFFSHSPATFSLPFCCMNARRPRRSLSLSRLLVPHLLCPRTLTTAIIAMACCCCPSATAVLRLPTPLYTKKSTKNSETYPPPQRKNHLIDFPSVSQIRVDKFTHCIHLRAPVLRTPLSPPDRPPTHASTYSRKQQRDRVPRALSLSSLFVLWRCRLYLFVGWFLSPIFCRGRRVHGAHHCVICERGY